MSIVLNIFKIILMVGLFYYVIVIFGQSHMHLFILVNENIGVTIPGKWSFVMKSAGFYVKSHDSRRIS